MFVKAENQDLILWAAKIIVHICAVDSLRNIMENLKRQSL